MSPAPAGGGDEPMNQPRALERWENEGGEIPPEKKKPVGPAEMIFVGDALFPGGNDYPAEEAGVASIRVKGPSETKRVIEAILVCLDGVRA